MAVYGHFRIMVAIASDCTWDSLNFPITLQARNLNDGVRLKPTQLAKHIIIIIIIIIINDNTDEWKFIYPLPPCSLIFTVYDNSDRLLTFSCRFGSSLLSLSPIGFFNPAVLTKIFPQSRNPEGFYWLSPIPTIFFYYK